MDADALFQEGYRLLPNWNDEGPDVDARMEAARAVILRAAEAGSLEAMNYLGGGGPSLAEAYRWAVAAARRGDLRAIDSLITDGDNGAEGREVLAAAHAGEAWAALTLARVYGSGSRNGNGVYVATIEGFYGWLPAVEDPAATARAWTERAAAAGFAPAHLDLARPSNAVTAEAALVHVQAALATGPLPPRLRTYAERLYGELLDRVDVTPAERFAARETLAAKGDAASIVWLADRYRRGEHVPVDLPRARALYEQGVTLASVDALRELGKLCETGKGGPKDLDRARALYEQAAELGADAYARGRLVKKFGLAWYGPGGKAPAAR